MSSKTALQEFVEANQALLTCYNQVGGPAEFGKLSDSQKENLCSSHREKIRDILRGNQLIMSNLIRERVEILKKLGASEQIVIRK